MAWLRTTGPKERPPPRNKFTRAEPWRAEPVPFCRYIFLPVRVMSARFLTACVPARRLASCQVTQRCRMSARAVRPKIASGRSTDPTAAPSSVVTFSSMSRPLTGSRRCRGFRSSRGRSRRGIRQAELARQRQLLRRRLLDRVAQHDPTALVARHRALDVDQAALHVGHDDLEIERGDALDAQVTGHFLVLERLARVLTPAGRAVRAVRDRNTMRGAQSSEIPALHRARVALADRGSGHIDILADHEMVGGDLRSDRNKLLLADAELGKLALGLDLGGGEMAPLGLADIVGLAGPGAELERDVTVLVLGAVSNDLAIGEPQHRRRHMLARIGEDPHHSDFLRNHPGTHVVLPFWPLQLDLDVDAGGEIELHERVHGLR